MKKTIFFALIFLFSLTTLAKVELPTFFGNNMVLQQQTNAAIWGKATPNTKVTIAPSWTKTKTIVTANATGKWMARIATPQAGGPYDINISEGYKDRITLTNVLIGEVWFCSGQSNMEMPFKGYSNQPNTGCTDIILSSKASTPIRSCTVKRNYYSRPLTDAQTTGWLVNDTESVGNVSAVAYWFALRLYETLGIPVGLLIADWGGTVIETWMDEKTIRDEFASEFDISYLGSDNRPKDVNHPCLTYNGMIHPLVPFTFKGMIWYQGESNRGRHDQYVRLQTAYVKMMRQLFEVPDAPFYFVQIAPHAYNDPNDWTSGYFCEAQQKCLETIPNSGMAVTVDAGEYACIHPHNKEAVGKRLAYLALEKTYGIKGIEATAPTYQSMKIEGNKAIITFNVSKDGISPLRQNLDGFEMAGADRVFYPAKGRCGGGNTIQVTCDKVSEPVAVRYCFRNWCIGSFFNNYGIPVAPFRTDNW